MADLDPYQQLDPNIRDSAAPAAPAPVVSLDPYQQLDPRLDRYGHNVSIDHLERVPNTTPGPRPPISAWDAIKGGLGNSYEDLKKFGGGVYNTFRHPVDTFHSLGNSLPPVNAMESMVNAAPGTAAGVAINSLTPVAREALIQQHPELQKMSDMGANAPDLSKTIGDYISHRVISRPGEETGTAIKYSAKDEPFQSAADVASLLSLPAGVSGLVAGGARLAGAGAAEAAANAVSASRLVRAADTVGTAMNPIGFVPDAPGNLVAGTGHVLRGLGAERVGNALVYGGNVIKPTETFNNLSSTYGRVAMSGENRVFLDAAGNEAPRVAAALETARSAAPGTVTPASNLVDGSIPTGPESVANVVNAPRLQVLGEQAMKNQPELANARIQQRAAARTNNIEGSFGGPQDRVDALAARTADRATNYSASGATTFPIDQPMLDVLRTPPGLEAINQININRATRRLPPLGSGANGDVQLGDTLDGETVHQIKKQFDDGRFRASGAAKPNSDNIRAIDELNTDFLRLVDRPGNNPMYNISRTTDAAHNLEIARGNTGAYMENRSNNPAAFEAARDNPENINTRNASIPIATGDSRYAHHTDYLNPDQLAALDRNSADLARGTEASRQAGLATDYKSDLDNAFDPVHSPLGMGLKGHIAAALFNNTIKGINPEVAANVSRSLMTPGGTLDLANNALGQQASIARRQAFARNWIANPINNALIRQPTMYNILEEQRNAMRDATNQKLGSN